MFKKTITSVLISILVNTYNLCLAQALINGVPHHTIDSALVANLSLRKGQTTSIVILDVKTGQVTYKTGFQRLKSNECVKINNIADNYVFPYSLAKLPTLWCLLKDNSVHLMDSINLGTGYYRVGKLRLKDVHYRTNNITVLDAFAENSDVAFARLINEVYRNHPQKYYRSMLTMFYPNDAHISNEFTMLGKDGLSKCALGMAVKATPLQMCSWFNLVAKAQLSNTDKNTTKDTLEYLYKDLHHALRQVSISGTAYSTPDVHEPNPFEMCIKTCTSRDHITAMIAGYFPSHHPKYTMIILLNTKNEQDFYSASAILPVYKFLAKTICRQ